jgi:aryl-alcohol dehydrogenase-like predicted oxidoreductase
MNTRRLGSEGPEVSVVGLGCNNFGMRIDADATMKVVDAAIDAGITLLDTADTYSTGKSEEFLGRALAGRRDSVLIASKWGKLAWSGDLMPGAPDVPRGSREYIRWSVEGSLKRLGTDWIDVYQHHEPDEETPIEETLAALGELVDEGKIRFIGSSNYSPAQIEEADRVAREAGLPRFVSAQNRYSLVHREAEAELLPTCDRLAIGFLPFFPLESGLLTGKVKRGQPPPEGTRLADSMGASFLTDEAFDRAETLERYAEEQGATLLEVAIGGMLAAAPMVASVIAGATKPEQVHANADAGRWEPAVDAVAALTALR